jgi:predicted RNase H-like HicB family nuclease
MTKQIKIIVEKNEDGYVAYPLGIQGVVVGQGDTYEDAIKDLKSAIKFHIETFGNEVANSDPEILEAYLTETGIELNA